MNAKVLLNSALKRLIFGLITFMACIGLLIVFLNKVDANSPTFFLSANGCGSPTREISGTAGENKTLYACVDGGNEGAGLFGAEINIAYDSSLLKVTSVSCRNFDSCSNLSSPGNIRLLGVSGRAPEGNAVSNRETFGTISFKLNESGTAQLSYTLATIIDENQGVQSRTGLGTRVSISAPAVQPTPEPESAPEAILTPPPSSNPESANEPAKISAPTPPPTANQPLAKVVISPLKTKVLAGQTVAIISRADYEGGRASENITSCFDCPTVGNKLANGKIKYIINGPASVYDNRVTIKSTAKAGEVIRVSAIYTDYNSNTTATSNIRGITVLAAPQACDPATGANCAPEVGGPSDLAAPERGTGCFNSAGAPIDCPISDPGCVNDAGAPIDCPPEEVPGCDPSLRDCNPPQQEPSCVDSSGNPIPCPSENPTCDPNREDCGINGDQPKCDPNKEDCNPPSKECDPKKEICNIVEPECNPETENCGDNGQGECDPNKEDCGLDGDPDCQGNCDKKEAPDCQGDDCQPGKKDHELLCHVLDVKKDKFIGALIYLPKDEAQKHLDEHEPDYLVSDIDNNPNNDSEDCLGIDICEYKKLHGSSNETDQCNTQEILKLTEMSLFHPAADECATCKAFIPVKPNNEFCSLNYSTAIDSDQDGLSDRTECLLNTQINQRDSDNDTCWDGDEVNLFHTNPLVQTDCILSKKSYDSVIITDPKENWIVKSLDISGLTPKTTLDVGVTAFPIAHQTLNPVLEDFDKLVNNLQQVIDPANVVEQEKRKSELLSLTQEIKGKIQAFYAFTKTQEATHYEKEISILKTVESYLEKTPDEMLGNFSEAEALKRSLTTIKTGGTFLGLVNQFNEVAVGDEVVNGFNLIPRVPLADGFYDLVAVARLKNKTLTSEPVSMVLDSTIQTHSPQPKALDGIALDPQAIKQGWELTSESSLSKIEVKTKNGRPVISGQSNYGAQIFATWESLALSSSIIVDSSEGGFEIQAPRELNKNQDHKVTLYAVLDTERGKIRSDNVTVNFHVQGTNYILWGLVGLILIGLAGLLARHRMKKIDALPPEHRAKENELYHAFGEKENPPAFPENHFVKQEEVRSVFEK